MYDEPFGLPTVTGWCLAGVVVVLLVARAVRVEWRATRDGAAPRSPLLDTGLDVALGLAVTGLVATLAWVVLEVFG